MQDHEKEKQEMGYVKVDKPPRTRRTIYTEKKYIVKGPDEAFIDPKVKNINGQKNYNLCYEYSVKRGRLFFTSFG